MAGLCHTDSDGAGQDEVDKVGNDKERGGGGGIVQIRKNGIDGRPQEGSACGGNHSFLQLQETLRLFQPSKFVRAGSEIHFSSLETS